jgi:extradiol dioxygenase family protein
VEPILHLSLPVRDLGESVDFYEQVLECDVGRVREHFVDVWFFGMQVTLHARPEQVLSPEQRGVHHFGVTLDADDLRRLIERARANDVVFLSALSTDCPGTPREQTKAKILDPSGHAIELKTYLDPRVALELGEAFSRTTPRNPI